MYNTLIKYMQIELHLPTSKLHVSYFGLAFGSHIGGDWNMLRPKNRSTA